MHWCVCVLSESWEHIWRCVRCLRTHSWNLNSHNLVNLVIGYMHPPSWYDVYTCIHMHDACISVPMLSPNTLTSYLWASGKMTLSFLSLTIHRSVMYYDIFALQFSNESRSSSSLSLSPSSVAVCSCCSVDWCGLDLVMCPLFSMSCSCLWRNCSALVNHDLVFDRNRMWRCAMCIYTY